MEQKKEPLGFIIDISNNYFKRHLKFTLILKYLKSPYFLDQQFTRASYFAIVENWI